jgi:limonene-1,2-epoxide hydrolase
MSSNIDTVLLFIRASEEEKIETALDTFTEDGVWVDPAGKVYGGADIEPYLKQQIELLHTFTAQGITVNYGTPIAHEDRVYLPASVNQADGTEVRRFVDVFVLRDSKIVLKDVFAKG